VLGSFSIATLGWRQGELQEALVASVGVVAAAAAAAAALFALGRELARRRCVGERCGGWTAGCEAAFRSTRAEAVLLASLAAAAAGLALLCLSPSAPALRLGMLLLLLAGVGLWPSMLLLLTRHFAAGQRAQAQALVVASCTVALAAAAPCFSRSLFDPSAHGSRAALPFAAGLASVLLALLLAWRTLRAGLLLAPVRDLHHAAGGERGGEMEPFPLHL